MRTLALLCLLFFLPPQQSPKPETVALALGLDRTVIMKTVEAEKLYAKLEKKRLSGTLNAEDERMHAALTFSLGTLPTQETLVPALDDPARLDWEIRRGVHMPLRQSDPRRDN